MAKIHINNPKQVINGGAKKYYFKVKGLGGPKGDKGDKGDTGATGPQGPQGNAATVSIGSTTTLPVGYDATVTNSGSIYNAVLNFGIPQGPRGPQGATGATGAKGDKGDQGNPGPQGEKGTNATVYVGTTSTLNPGSQATVYNSGTDSNAVLNFGIPKGEKGDTGPMPTIAQTTGQAIDQVMSQKATTDALNTKQATITSSNKLSADLVTDTSTTNKFVTASDITNWDGKQDALTAGTGIDITGGVISTPAIVPEVVAELPTTGEEGKLYLTPKAHTTQTATGNPITATVAEDAGAIESLKLDGDTFQQTYTGKNLLGLKKPSSDTFGFELAVAEESGTITVDGTFTGGGGGFPWISDRQLSIPAGTYTFSMKNPQSFNVSLRMFDAQGQYTGGKYIAAGATSRTFTLEYDCVRVAILIGAFSVGKTLNNQKFEELQLEVGSTATSFEPYVGGQASPNPDYPQAIQTVTGEQTITINDTDYPLDLGSIELCRIDTYQDYIYKDGENWKVHKDIGKYQFNGAEPWIRSGSSTQDVFVAVIASALQDYLKVKDRTTLKSPSFIWRSSVSSASGQMDAYNGSLTAPIAFALSFDATSITNITDAITWISNNKPTVYSAINNPTDTVITDQALIAQLEAIRTASLENGTNTITNTATGTNLAGDMEIGYFGFNPTNRYDKFIWLDLNNNYEQIGGE